MGIILKKIKEIYKYKSAYCEAAGISIKGRAKRFRGHENNMKKFNEDLKHLNLKVVITEVGNNYDID